MRERDLGRIPLSREHRFAVERAADRDAIEAADELAVDPDLDAVSMAQGVESRVGLLASRG
jgi:hypothetical protein